MTAITRTKLLISAFAVILGFVIGSWDRIRSQGAGSTNHVDPVRESTGLQAASEVAVTPGDSRAETAPDVTTDDKIILPVAVEQDINMVRAGRGVVLESAFIAGEFIGYRVIEVGDDPRMNAGEIIVSIGGVPVEEAAAGSELMIIALMDEHATIGFAER